MVFPVVGQALVECAVFFRGDVLRITCPDGLGLVELLVRDLRLLDLLGLLVFGLVLLIVNFLDLGLFCVFLLFLFVLNLLMRQSSQ
jgi:hypothetical protein